MQGEKQNSAESKSSLYNDKSKAYVEKVIMDLSEVLRQPSDIDSKLEMLEAEAKDNYEIHQNKFNTKISNAYSQIKNLNNNFDKLKLNLKLFENKKNQNIQILEDFSALIKDYKTISSICVAHQRFFKIKNFIEKLNNINDDLTDDDLLVYHNRVYQDEEFACELQQYNYELLPDDLSRVENAKEIIQKKSLEFTLILMELIKDFINNYKSISHINEIVDQEEKRDELTRMAIEGDKGKDPVLTQVAKMYPRYITRNLKNLKIKLIKVIKSSIREKFNTEGKSFISNLDFVLKDLVFINKKINLDFFLFDDFLLEYHKNLRNGIKRNVDNMDAGEILKLVEFKTDYYNLIETKFNKIAESLGERLIDGENVLLEKYSKAASQKLKGWIENITKSELERFRRRDKELNRDENDKLISPGFINLLQLIKVQLEPITFNKNVFLYIAKTVYDYCNEFKENICEAIEADFVPTCKNKSMPGYEDYCIMFGNSGLKLTQYITSLPQCQSDEIRELGNVFIGILKFANHFLSEFVIFTCNPAFKKIFTSSWNESFKVFLVTIDDFLTDYSVVMSDFTFNTFCNELCSCITSAYFKRLNEKNVVIDVNSGENIRNDYNRLLKVFDKFLPSENLEVELSPLIKLIPLFTVNDPDMISLELKSLIMSTENIDIKMIENIITQRSNLYEKTKLKMIEKLRVIYEQTANQKKKIFN